MTDGQWRVAVPTRDIVHSGFRIPSYITSVPEPVPPKLAEIEAALRLFDETTTALAARINRLEEVVVQKQQELVAANHKLSDNVAVLDRTTAWLNLVMESVASGVVAIDRDGIVTTCNRAAEETLSMALPDPIGADWRAVFPDSPLLLVLGGTTVPAYERQVRGRDGRSRVLAAKAAALRGPDGILIGAVEVFEDVTEVRRLQETVERADRLKQLGEMAAGVAHEIRNPLNGIEGFASLLVRDLPQDGSPEDDKRHRFAAHIVEGVRTLNRTVSALLAFTNPRRIERRPAIPGELAAACLELVRAGQTVTRDEAETAEVVALELDDRGGGEVVSIDGVQLKQVLLNLVQNAVQAVQGAGRSGGRVLVTVTRDAGQVVFSVDDNGPGVPREERQRIFTPFYTTKDHGTGLGLAIAHTVVSLHGGALTVDDAPLGGARFRMVVPV
jgi:PAS domain S-box-containing protein